AAGKTAYCVASESVVFNSLAFNLERDIAPGEAVFITFDGQLHSRQCADNPHLNPCLFEYVYFARPDSVMDGVSVYQARVNMGVTLAEKVKQALPLDDIDVVMPIPDTSRPSAMQLAHHLGKPYREGLIKNRYIGRTFIMPTTDERTSSVDMKLAVVPGVVRGKRIIVVDDSLIRGTTSQRRVRALREAGAREIHLRISCPPTAFPCYFGIDFPSREELIASNQTVEEIRNFIGADSLGYLSLAGLKNSVQQPHNFCTGCFTGIYPYAVPDGHDKHGLESG
ncbi:MAG: amidophosphoribosyltransferase, partial [Kiritimatiellae bacterium]|nr:amidophosphoribosyltransferase [Kiritimatiellia bacterium]